VNPLSFQPMHPQQFAAQPFGASSFPQTAGSVSVAGTATGGFPGGAMAMQPMGGFPQAPGPAGFGGFNFNRLIGTLEQLGGTVSQMLQALRGGFGQMGGYPQQPTYPGMGYPMPMQPYPMQMQPYPMQMQPYPMPMQQQPYGFGMQQPYMGQAPVGPYAGISGFGGLPIGMPAGFGMPVGAAPGFAPSPFGFGGLPMGGMAGMMPFGVGGFPVGFGGMPGLGGAGFGAVTGMGGIPGGVPGQAIAPTAGSAAPAVQLGQDDFVDFLLAGSRGGTAGTDELIESRFARPGSRFSQAGNNEFQAVIASAYSSQFKAFALGLDAVFAPGKDVNQLAANISRAQSSQFTPEADLLSKVAAVYRGNLTGVNRYNNQALQQVLVRWGRQDLASQPGVGSTDVESIGSVIKALNEQPNPQIRQAWLQDIFDFQNNSPSSPSGAVPNVREYQDAINIVRSGTLDRLLGNYQQGIRTDGPVEVPVTQGVVVPNGANVAPTGAQGLPGGQPGPAARQHPDVDFRQLNNAQRTQMSNLTDRERAVVHLWGRQMIAKGGQDGGILLTVMEDVQRGQASGSVSVQPAEVQLAQELLQRDNAEFGGVTGKNLDREFFRIMRDKFGEPELEARYGNSPIFFAAHDPNGAAARLPDEFPVDSPQWEAAMSRRSGLNSFENGVLRLWGHDILDGGVDGSILAFTMLGGDKALDRGMNRGVVDALLKADAADGRVDGSSLKSSFRDVMDKLYLGPTQPGASAERTFRDAEIRGQSMGLTLQQMGQNMQLGAEAALGVARDFVQNHPIITAGAAGGMMAATGVCPFLGGLAAGGAGVAMGQQFLNRQQPGV